MTLQAILQCYIYLN